MREKSGAVPETRPAESDPFDQPEAIARGDRMLSNLEKVRDFLAGIAEYNPEVALRDFRVVIDLSRHLRFVPAEPVNRSSQRIYRKDPTPRWEKTSSPFKIVIPSLAAEIRDGQVGLRLTGSNEIADDGTFYRYDFDPLSGHGLSVIADESARRFPAYREGIAYLDNDTAEDDDEEGLRYRSPYTRYIVLY